MPNLVGIGNSQVPTNAMLGGLAYKDSVGEIDIDKIKAKTGDTAIDVFVYDTRKDSDGGAWRHRTQNTSWYNEGASADRGARKEFPAVVVIVAETDLLTIYDADDPNLPMWMVFKAGGVNGANMIGRTSEDNNSVSMLNGLMCVGRTSFGLHMINFIADRARFKEAGYDTPYNLPIGTHRNGGNTWLGANVDGNDIANDLVYEIAMTVRPNAPIDSATGLPIPTIAVATAGGVSVIKDDRTVIDLNDALGSTRPVRNVIIRGNDILYWNVNNGTIQQFFDAFSLAADSTNDVKYNYYIGGGHATTENVSAILRKSNSDGPFKLVTINPKSFATAAQSGMSIFVDGVQRTFSVNNNSIFDSRVAYVTSNYNTGYMHGDIRGAFLSNTDATNITGSELVTNGTFASNISGWSGAAQFSHSTNSIGGNTGGKLMVYHTANTNIYISQTITTVAGKYYTISYLACSDTASKARVWIGGTYYDYIVDNNNAALVEHSHTFYASGTSTEIRLYTNGASRSYWDSVSVRVAELDRSIKNKGLQVFGTVTKSKVATGADLVGYGGNGTTSYLEQPYNSDLDFGANADFSIMGWLNTPNVGGGQYIFDRSVTYNSSRDFQVWIAADLRYMTIYIAGGQVATTGSGKFPNNTWFHYCVLRRSDRCIIYIDGKEIVNNLSTVSTIASSNVPAKFIYNNNANTKHALLRISKTAPSAEQVKKIYDDEKCLFHDNAKCTLYGTSDNVKALAFDDATNILHVGTSAGRSDFRGLNRINNTTTAVTTAISASNELVAEQ